MVRHREFVLRFVKRIRENRKDRVFFPDDDALLQRCIKLGIRDLLRIGTDGIKGGEKPRGRRHADFESLQVVRGVDRHIFGRRLPEPVVKHRKPQRIMFGKPLVHPAHHEVVDRTMGVRIVRKKKRRRHRI